MNTALILIDIQNDYFPGGRMELVGSEQASQCASRLLNAFRDHHLPLVFIQHIAARPGATFFLPDTPGAEIHPNIQPHAGETVIVKHFPNSFRETPLLDRLQGQGIERLVVAGMMTHMCVDATTRAAADYGFECLIASDACATRALTFEGRTVSAPDVHAAFLAALNGTYGRVLPVETILAEISS